MSFLVILGIAVGLALDAFAVAVGASAALGRVTARQVFRLAFHFGLFQAVMPLVGWLAGRGLEGYIAGWDHWLAFGLLAFVGGKAIVTALRGGGAFSASVSLRADVGRVAPGPPSSQSSGVASASRRAEGGPPYIPEAERPACDKRSVERRIMWPGPGERPPEKDPTRGATLLMLSVATSIDALAVGLSLGVLEVAIWYPALIIGVVTAGLTVLGMDLGSRIGLRFGRSAEILGGLVLIGIGLKILVEHLVR
jgi:putative Mn2+ efflux pump MntP